RAACPVLVVDAAKCKLLVNDKEKTLTQSRFNVIQCLLNAYPDKLTKDALGELQRPFRCFGHSEATIPERYRLEICDSSGGSHRRRLKALARGFSACRTFPSGAKRMVTSI